MRAGRAPPRCDKLRHRDGFVPILGGKQSETLLVRAYLRQGAWTQFDPKTTSELRVGAWSETPRDYNIDIDDSAFEM